MSPFGRLAEAVRVVEVRSKDSVS